MTRVRIVGAGALLAMTLVAYGPALNASFIWDDDMYVTHNEQLRTWAGLRSIWLDPTATPQYYPLIHTTLWLQYHVWALRPLGYHLVNVVLHGLNAGLAWLVFRQLALPGAWLAAAAFALHPLHVESVAWVTELKNVQAGFFFMLAMLAYLRFVFDRRSKGAYAAAFLCFVLALLSKTVACTLPAAVLVCLWWKRGGIERRDVGVLAPFFAVGLASGLVTSFIEKAHVGAEGEEWALSVIDRCLVAGRALWFYAGKILLPVRLTFIYPRWGIDSAAWWQYLFPAATIAVALALWSWQGRIGRGPLAAALYFAVTLAPALGFVDVYPFRYSFVADHFSYLASLGPIALVAAGVGALRSRPRVAVGGALLLALGGATWQRCHAFTSPETLWRDTLAKNPSAWMAHNNLGLLLLQEGKPAEAAEHFESALRLHPAYLEALYNLGNAAVARGRLDDARAYYELALQVAPTFAPAHNNLANVYAYQGRLVEAIQHYEKALELLPDYPEARDNLNAVRNR